MGAGTNVQRRLVALTHLDAPWRPRDIEQREGRILRQGNRNAQVRIFRCVTTGSFDAYMWQLLEVKARFIAQVMCGQVSTRRARLAPVHSSQDVPQKWESSYTSKPQLDT
jgi:SNF2 family DNA or RNA helicase